MGVDPLSDGEVREERRRWGVIITGEQEDNVERAIDAASDMAGVNADGKGFLLDLIATHFLTFCVGSTAENKDKHHANFRDDFLSKIQGYLGVELIAVLPDTNDVVFGNLTVERIETENEGA
jgi:hypothetical protein